jgi:hypothetical protein
MGGFAVRACALFFLLQRATICLAHPAYLDCNGLSEALKTNQSIMVGPPRHVPWSRVPGSVTREGSDSHWTNYSISLSSGLQFVLETLGGVEATNFNHGLCGCDPGNPGHGLCQKCSTQLYAENFDCTGATKCVFGISAQRNANASLLLGWSTGSVVFYTFMPQASPHVVPALAAVEPSRL